MRAWTISREDRMATITLDRPERHNVIELSEIDDLISDLDVLDNDSDLRVIVLTGTGDKSFSSGVNLGEVLDHDWTDNPVERLADRIEALKPVTISALNGNAYGAACDLALACDFRVGVNGMRIVMPPARLGVVFHESGLRRFVSRTGVRTARRLFLLAENIDAAELLETGYLDLLVDRKELSVTVADLAQRLIALSPLSLQTSKKAINGLADGTLDAQWLKRETLRCFKSRDFGEGLTAYRERRKPDFRGL